MRAITFNLFIVLSLCGPLCCLLAQAQQVHPSTTNESGAGTTLAKSNEVNKNVTNEVKFGTLIKRIHSLLQHPNPDWNEYEQVAQELINEFPDRPDGYNALLNVLQFGDAKHARSLAKELINSSAPEEYRSWAKGFLYRMDLHGKLVELKFKALDGREVDLSKMRGKVVLIDFWATGCVPCVGALPEIKAVYDKYHAKGFEVVGISFDTDKEHLVRFIRENGLPWPEAFGGGAGLDNKFGQRFGVRAIPHTLLINKKGCLAIDNYYIRPQFEGVVSNLLAEP